VLDVYWIFVGFNKILWVPFVFESPCTS